ncbi:hypothetical protein KKF05_03780 [Patescibacteria group bacterium]|nr:hypothetical protein [Patescibacteria group bacterium]MBU1029425.1 hypothetical protein [Patescibacteria group bacterium]MBU1916451.1 hypothetical protein [Patescibacteria group bacterium]
MNGENKRNKFVVLALALLVILVAIDRALGTWDNHQPPVIFEAMAAEQSIQLTDNADDLGVRQTFETVQGTLLDICKSRGYGEDCAVVLLGILWKESLNNAQAIGDGGRARGYFQIHYHLHKISLQCAEDLSCSANWTLDYLESNGYPKYLAQAVQCHNGCGFANGYWQSALRWGNRKWNTPLFLDPARAEIAMK